MNAKEAILSVVTIGIIIFLPHAELLPFFIYTIPVTLITWLVLKYCNKTFADIGFSFKNFKPQSIVFGGIAAVVTLTFMQLVFHPFLDLFLELEYSDSGLNETIRGGKLQFFIMVILGWLIGGVYEEIVFHGFIFSSLEMIIKGKYRTHISFIITSIIFGVYHVQLGASGLINALVVGAIYLALFLYFKRNLWYSIFCHGVYNTLVMTVIYFDYL